MKPATENFDDVVVADFEPSNELVKPPSYGNASMTTQYEPPAWEPARGVEATRALQIKSRGVSC